MSELNGRNDLIKNFNFSDEDKQHFLTKLWELLKWQAEKFNSIDSTSMPIEKAQDILASLVYTLSLVADEDGMSADTLLQEDFQQVIRRGQDILARKRNEVYQSWTRLCLEAPNIHNVYYIATMRNLGLFFKRYEIYYEAHQIPCSIDYPLLNPVEEKIKGISFIEEYINRIRTENGFINFFDFDMVTEFFQRAVPDYQENYLNLCEPIVVNSIAKKILGQDFRELSISKSDISSLSSRFDGKTKSSLIIVFRGAVNSICKEIGFESDSAKYFNAAIDSLAIRVEGITKSGDLSNIFIFDE